MRYPRVTVERCWTVYHSQAWRALVDRGWVTVLRTLDGNTRMVMVERDRVAK